MLPPHRGGEGRKGVLREERLRETRTLKKFINFYSTREKDKSFETAKLAHITHQGQITSPNYSIIQRYMTWDVRFNLFLRQHLLRSNCFY